MSRKVETNAFFNDADNNLCLLFGNHFIGVEAGTVTYDGDEPDHQYVKFEELQEPYYKGESKKEDYKPRTDMPALMFLFPTVESVDTVIEALQEVREHLIKQDQP